MALTIVDEQANLEDRAAMLAERWWIAACKRALKMKVQEKVAFLVQTFGEAETASMVRVTRRTVREWHRGLSKPGRSSSESTIDQAYRLSFALTAAIGRQAAVNFWSMRQDALGEYGNLVSRWGMGDSFKAEPFAQMLLLAAARDQLLGEQADEIVLVRMAEIRERLSTTDDALSEDVDWLLGQLNARMCST